MDLAQYQEQAIRTESRINNITVNFTAFKGFVEAYVAVGNIIDAYKKNLFYSREMNSDAINAHANRAVHSITTAIREFNSDDQQPPGMIHINPRMFHAMVGVCTESVELAEALLKVMDGVPQDDVNIQEEFFDVLWYVLVGHDVMQKDMNATLQMGFAKLQKRFPEKFTNEAAINRDVAAERTIMEEHQDQ